jgi:hypothetical protein
MATRPAKVTYNPTERFEPLGLFSTDNNFYVSIELIAFQEEIDKYPETWKNFEAAIQEWSRHIPVRWVVLIEDPAMPYSVQGRIGSVEVHLADLQSDDYNLPENLLGAWVAGADKILLDADSLETYSRAFSVCLHELGHLLGVPHIVGFEDLGRSGFVILPPGEIATGYVMYPNSVKDLPQKKLSSIEIDLAYNHLLHYWTLPHSSRKTQDCSFSVDK